MRQPASDQQELSNLISRYAQALDGADIPGVLDSFTVDAIANYDGGTYRVAGHDALRRHFEGFLTAPSTHLIGNTLIEVEGSARARIQCSAVAFVTRETGFVVIRGLVYEMRCVKQSNWLIAELLHRTTWSCRVAQ